MRYLILLMLFLLFSCESEITEKEVISVAGKSLKTINHTFYNYLYENEPATRTYTSNMTLNNQKITTINNTIFHYFNDDLSRNYTYTTNYSYLYNSFGLLVTVQSEEFSDLNPTIKVENTYDFIYNSNNDITEINYRNSFGDILTKYLFTYTNNEINKRVEYYDSFGLVYYNEINLLKNNTGKIYKQSAIGPILSTTNINALSEIVQEATFDTNNNLETLALNGEVYTEFTYRNTEIPDFLRTIKLPSLAAFPHHILMGDFSQITAYNNSNFVYSTNAKSAASFNKEYRYIFSIENFPLEVEVTANNKTESKTIYTYN